MGSKKIRDYDGILKILKGIEKEMENLNKSGKKLGSDASTAEGVLRDRVAKKNIDAVKSMGETISKLAATGEERIRELIRAVEADQREFEDLEH